MKRLLFTVWFYGATAGSCAAYLITSFVGPVPRSRWWMPAFLLCSAALGFALLMRKESAHKASDDNESADALADKDGTDRLSHQGSADTSHHGNTASASDDGTGTGRLAHDASPDGKTTDGGR